MIGPKDFIKLAERLTFFYVLMFAYEPVVIVTKRKFSLSKDYQIWSNGLYLAASPLSKMLRDLEAK